MLCNNKIDNQCSVIRVERLNLNWIVTEPNDKGAFRQKIPISSFQLVFVPDLSFEAQSQILRVLKVWENQQDNMGVEIPIPFIGQKITAAKVKAYVSALLLPAVYLLLESMWQSFLGWNYFNG